MVNFRRDVYPFVGQYWSRDGIQRHYLDEGEGEPVVMLHGNPTWSFFFRDLILETRKTRRCIAPDHVGCGYSDKPSDKRYSYTLKQRVDDVEEMLERLGIRDNITLVLHDWGGMIGMAFATRHPERIKRLVLLNTGAFHLPKDKTLPWQIKLCRNEYLGDFMVRRMNAFALGALRTCTTHPPLPRTVQEGYLAPYNNYANRIGVHRFVQDIPLQPGEPSYELVDEVQRNLGQFSDTPTLICWGEQDFVFDHTFLAEWESRLPRAEVHRFPGAGHYVLEDAGAEIIPLVGQFLEKHPLKAAK